MLQFTDNQIVAFRERVKRSPAILQDLEKQIQPVRDHYHIPDTGIATWGGYYACPKHSVALEFDIASPDAYRCPQDGEILTGEPYTGAWWRLLNAANERACSSSALRYLLQKDKDDLALARNILVDYAKRYPTYEVHGGIPYNNPGKANAQTLCDSMWIKSLASAYDIIRNALSEADRVLIEQDLFHCAAEFLMGQRTNQIHNHECIVSSAVGILGLLLDEPEYLAFALDTPYGLCYQLEHAILSDGFWFEGAPSYHFYAMEQFMDFERFAAGSSRSFFNIPRFVEVLKFPLRIVQPDGTLPPLNDSGQGNRGFGGTENLYELAYARTGDVDFARMLHLCYDGRDRTNRYSFFDGAEALPEVPALPQADYHAQESKSSGLTTMHGPDSRFLLVKHSPYGGEHDHYDRLGLHFLAFGDNIASDIGTSQYGAPLHYAYYKNTASHNTVCINGENQPPTDCRVLSYYQSEDCVALVTEATWDGSYQMLDSFTICQWTSEAYAGAVFRRSIHWYKDFFVDCFDVALPEVRSIVWTFHVSGALQAAPLALEKKERWAKKGAGQYLHNVTIHTQDAPVSQMTWRTQTGIQLDVFCYAQAGLALCTADGPDNPSVQNLSYLLERKQGRSARFVNVVCASNSHSPGLMSVTQAEGGLKIQRANGSEVFYEHPEEIKIDIQEG